MKKGVPISMGVKKNIQKTFACFGHLPIVGTLFTSKDKIAIVRLSGVISDQGVKRKGISHNKFEKIFERAFDVHNLKALALIINSPGGSPAQSSLIGHQIRTLSEEKKVPVFAFVEDVAASGGYWLACAADEIYAQESSIVGSIGVISTSFGLKALIEKHGIERRVHSAGKEKSFLDPFLEEKPADIKKLKTIQKDIHNLFVSWVKKRRGDRIKGADKDLFEGQFWTAKHALDLGMIDGCADLKPWCKDKFGKDVKFIAFGQEKGLVGNILSGESKFSDLTANTMPEEFLDTIESRSIWGRFGL